jgi:hypothetical protein
VFLPFLYPQLQRPVRVHRAIRNARAFTGSLPHRQQDARPHRYGTANEPPPHLKPGEGADKDGKRESSAANVSKDAQASKAKEDASQTGENASDASSSASAKPSLLPAPPPPPTPSSSSSSAPSSAQQDAANTTTGKSSSKQAQDATEPPPTTGAPSAPHTPESQPLETVLDIPAQTTKAPHLKTPPYVHHFDTYSLVKRLEEGGFTQDQSVSMMKGIRSLLADNMELAKEGLVSKSDVENETYLFRAACSELKTEVQNNRKSEMEKMRSERTQLQHEVDILSQLLNQESQTLKEDLKGLFDDRKMAVRMEQKGMESKVRTHICTQFF